MNYRKIYMKIISKAKLEIRKKGNGTYYEQHHILPKSLFPLWKKKELNLVLLTAREHFICHQMLAKIYPKKMLYALWRLVNNNQQKYVIKNSKTYENIRIAYCNRRKTDKQLINKVKNSLSEFHKNNPNAFKGRKVSEEGKKKLSDAHKGIKWSEKRKEKHEVLFGGKFDNNKGKHWYNNGDVSVIAFECPIGFKKGKIGRKHTEKEKLEKSIALKKFWSEHKGDEKYKKTEEQRKKISESTKRGMANMTLEQKAKMSQKGRIPWNKGLKYTLKKLTKIYNPDERKLNNNDV